MWTESHLSIFFSWMALDINIDIFLWHHWRFPQSTMAYWIHVFRRQTHAKRIYLLIYCTKVSMCSTHVIKYISDIKRESMRVEAEPKGGVCVWTCAPCTDQHKGRKCRTYKQKYYQCLLGKMSQLLGKCTNHFPPYGPKYVEIEEIVHVLLQPQPFKYML